MSREVCFCGWMGSVEDREPVYAGDGQWALRCPSCGHLDYLHWLSATNSRAMFEEAQRRQRAQQREHEPSRDGVTAMSVTAELSIRA